MGCESRRLHFVNLADMAEEFPLENFSDLFWGKWDTVLPQWHDELPKRDKVIDFFEWFTFQLDSYSIAESKQHDSWTRSKDDS